MGIDTWWISDVLMTIDFESFTVVIEHILPGNTPNTDSFT